MKVFNLRCEHGHDFEGWFASSQDYESQQQQSLLQCPLCDSAEVERLPSAPRLNLGASAQPSAPQKPAEQSDAQEMVAPTPAQMQALWVQMARHVQANSEDVGDRFPEEARRIHYNEAPERSIRGVASEQEAAELHDEGIEVLALPMPRAAKDTLQ